MRHVQPAIRESPLFDLAKVLVEGSEPDRERPARASSAWRRVAGDVLWWVRLRFVNIVVMSPLLSVGLRCRLMRLAGYQVAGVRFESGSVVRSRRLRIGTGSRINHHCYLAAGDITIGRNVGVSVGVTFLAGDHRIGPPQHRLGEDADAPIVVGDGCWIGANVTILRGVTIAAGCIIGAGAVVTKDTEPDGVYVGVPAHRTCDLPLSCAELP